MWNAQTDIKMTFQSHMQAAILSVLLFLDANAKDSLKCIDSDIQSDYQTVLKLPVQNLTL